MGERERKEKGGGEWRGCPQALPLVFELLFENDASFLPRLHSPLEKPLGGRLGGGWRDSQGVG
jgi:hypothetical protein